MEDLMQIVIGIILIISALFLIVAVLMQHGKSHNLSGTIAGGAETFFGKEKGKRIDKILSRATTVIGALFMIASLLAFVLQDGGYRPQSKNLSFLDVYEAPVEDVGADVGEEDHADHNH